MELTTEMSQQLQKAMAPPIDYSLIYKLAQNYEKMGQNGDAYFFYWLANQHQYSCFEDVTRVFQIHPQKQLILKIKDPSIAVRLSAIDSMMIIGGYAVSTPLIELLPDTVWQVRYRALTALESISNYFSAEYIHHIIKDSEEVIRQHAAICLGNLMNQESVPILLKMLEDEDPVVRQLSIRSLGNFKITDLITEKISQMIHDRDAFVRRSAREGLKKMQSLSSNTDTLSSSRENIFPIHPF